MLATFETAAQGVCHGTQTTRNDADVVQIDRGTINGDLATFTADSRVVTSGIPELSADAATLRRDIESADYTPPGATSDLAAIRAAIDSARSTLASARSFVTGAVQTATALSTEAKGYAATAQGGCNQLRPSP
jgi:hypothetical protein